MLWSDDKKGIWPVEIFYSTLANSSSLGKTRTNLEWLQKDGQVKQKVKVMTNTELSKDLAFPVHEGCDLIAVN